MMHSFSLTENSEFSNTPHDKMFTTVTVVFLKSTKFPTFQQNNIII